jgi:hypothetical protein
VCGTCPWHQVVDEDAGDAANPNPQRKQYYLDPKKVIPLPFDESEYDPMQVCKSSISTLYFAV